MNSKRIKASGRCLIFGVVLIILCASSCSRKVTLDEYIDNELRKNIRRDSLVYGIHFGMSFQDFDTYCLQMNKNGIFRQNPNGSAVRLEFHKGFGDLVYFDFFPEASVDNKISQLKGALSYKDFSYYDKKFKMENLLKEAKTFFEQGYEGNHFFKIRNDHGLLKYKYVKIDGNRKIVLTPTFAGQKIAIDFEDTTIQ